MRTSIVGIAVYDDNVSDLEALLCQAPIESGLTFVVIQAVSSARTAVSVDSLAANLPLPVYLTEETTTISPNSVYVVPPNRQATFEGGRIRISSSNISGNLRQPIDIFFQSLARELADRAIGIFLPGMDDDGEAGIRAIADHGGLTFAQVRQAEDGATADVAAMRRKVADIVATPRAVMEQLTNHARGLIGAEAPETFEKARDSQQRAITYILRKLAQQTGHHFNGYKENTIFRRIHRRMVIQQVARLEDYAHLLDEKPSEIDVLFQELLIGVTSFFRDSEAFGALEEQVIAPLFLNARDPTRPIRIWVPGCSTGEEAYSIAMILFDYAQRHRRIANFQIFATDINPVAIEVARRGSYSPNIAMDISRERLQRYFVREDAEPYFTVSRRVRDVVVFALQNLICDPPFSRLDLICCRNVMIYFEPELQQRLLGTMHHALNPRGCLFLGNSEALGHSHRFFRQVDQHWKIYQRNEVGSDARFPVVVPNRWSPSKTAPPALKTPPERKSNLRELTERLLLAEHTPTAIVVNGKGDMFYAHGRTGRFLEQTTGDVTTNILKVAREGLRIPLAKALHQVTKNQQTATIDRIVLRDENDVYHVHLSISYIDNPHAPQDAYLITLTEKNSTTVTRAEDVIATEAQWSYVTKLETELDSTREYLQATIEQLETANHALTRTNDDLQSSNEELQRANEELQTSKEELQSVNEELSFVNTELRQKIAELIRANNDIRNLLDNSEVGMIFLDTKLCIRRFARGSADIVYLLDSDVGRPLTHFVHRLHHDRLHDDIREVLATSISKELELQAHDNQWFLTRILPYRTVENEIDGVVLTFTNVTFLKETNEKLAFLVDALPVGISIIDRERKSFLYNPAYVRMCDLSGQDSIQHIPSARSFFRPDGTTRMLEEFAASRVLAGENKALNVESGFWRTDGTMTWLDVSAVACPFADWSAIIVTSDVTARRNAENALRESEDKFSRIFHYAPLMIGIIDIATSTLVDCNQRFLDVSGFLRDEAIGTPAAKLGWVPCDAAMRFLHAMSRDGFVCNEEVTCRGKDGRRIDCLYNGFIMEVNGKKQIVSMVQDVSERKRAEDTIKATLRKEKDAVLRELAHRTKNNMFVIRSMLNLHAMNTQNDEVRRLFADVENKIFAMALVHQKLYQSNNLSRLDLSQYLRELAPALLSSHSFQQDRISFNLDAESITVLIDTVIPCGLVVTELISNSFKYAFPDDRKGTITVRLFRRSSGIIHLQVSDDGVGVPEHFDFRQQTTLGLQTIFMIVEHQLKGTVTFHSSARGLDCMIDFADTLYSERV